VGHQRVRHSVFVYSLPDLKLLDTSCCRAQSFPARSDRRPCRNWATFTPDGKLLYVTNSAIQVRCPRSTPRRMKVGREHPGRRSAEARITRWRCAKRVCIVRAVRWRLIVAVAATLQAASASCAVSRLRVFQGAGRADLPEKRKPGQLPAATSVTRRATTPSAGETPAGSQVLDEEQSRRNFRDGLRLVVPGKTSAASRFCFMPLAPEAGGNAFHTAAQSSRRTTPTGNAAQWANGQKPGQEQVVPAASKSRAT